MSSLRLTRIRCVHIAPIHVTQLAGFDDVGIFDGASIDTAKTVEALSKAGVVKDGRLREPSMWGTDRSERIAVSRSFAEHLPVSCQPGMELRSVQARSVTSISEILVFESGSIIFWGVSEIEAGSGLDPGTGVHELRVARDAFEALIQQGAASLAEPCLAHFAPGIMGDRSPSSLRARPEVALEFIDFDVDESETRFCDMSKALPCARELVGFLRLSRSGVWEHYTSDFVSTFLKADLGHRDDDLWMAVGRRLFRRHPDLRPDVALYFRDVALVGAMLAARECAMLALVDSMQVGARTLLETSADGPIDVKTIRHSYAGLVKCSAAIARVSGPAEIARGFRHDFFQDISEAIYSELGLETLEDASQHEFASYVAALGSASQAYLALHEVGLNSVMKRLSWWMLSLSGVVLLVSIVQLLVAILGTKG